jgi:hypothetical protein
MKGNLLLCVATILLITSTAGAALSVHEYVPASGEFVTYDDVTGSHWIWDLSLLRNKTYPAQNEAIGALGNYGNVAGGWHMATYEEMRMLWSYDAATVANNFNPSGSIIVVGPGFYRGEICSGRYDEPASQGTSHYTADVIIVYDMSTSPPVVDYEKSPLLFYTAPDDVGISSVSAWVTTSAPVITNNNVVPAPGALILGAIGVVLTGWLRTKERSAISGEAASVAG